MATTAQLIDVLACDKVDSNGDPLSGYQVRTYASDGSTPANVWEERAKSTPKAEFTLGVTGAIEVYGDNTYVIKIWAATADPDVDSPYLTIGPVTYSFDGSGNVDGSVTGDIKATDGTIVLDNGTDGTDSTYVGDVTGNSDTATTATTADTSHKIKNEANSVDFNANRATYTAAGGPWTIGTGGSILDTYGYITPLGTSDLYGFQYTVTGTKGGTAGTITVDFTAGPASADEFYFVGSAETISHTFYSDTTSASQTFSCCGFFKPKTTGASGWTVRSTTKSNGSDLSSATVKLDVYPILYVGSFP